MFVNVYYFHVCFYNPSANCFGSNQLVHSHTHRAGPCILSLHLCNLSQHSFVVGTCGVAIKSGWCIPLLSVPGNVGTTVELSVFTPWACIEYGLVAMFLKTIFTLSPTSAWIWGPEWSERKISLLFWNFCVNDKKQNQVIFHCEGWSLLFLPGLWAVTIHDLFLVQRRYIKTLDRASLNMETLVYLLIRVPGDTAAWKFSEGQRFNRENGWQARRCCAQLPVKV